jgi:hypothetical protein
MAAMMVIIGTIDRSWKSRTEKARDARFDAEPQREIDERGQCQSADHHLHQPEAEDVLAQPPEPPRVELQTDQEQEERDADFRHRHDRIRFADQA